LDDLFAPGFLPFFAFLFCAVFCLSVSSFSVAPVRLFAPAAFLFVFVYNTIIVNYCALVKLCLCLEMFYFCPNLKDGDRAYGRLSFLKL